MDTNLGLLYSPTTTFAQGTLEFKAESFSHCATTLAHSPYFDLFWALVIGSNAAFLGAQLNYRDVNLFGVSGKKTPFEGKWDASTNS